MRFIAYCTMLPMTHIYCRAYCVEGSSIWNALPDDFCTRGISDFSEC